VEIVIKDITGSEHTFYLDEEDFRKGLAYPIFYHNRIYVLSPKGDIVISRVPEKDAVVVSEETFKELEEFFQKLRFDIPISGASLR